MEERILSNASVVKRTSRNLEFLPTDQDVILRRIGELKIEIEMMHEFMQVNISVLSLAKSTTSLSMASSVP